MSPDWSSIYPPHTRGRIDECIKECLICSASACTHYSLVTHHCSLEVVHLLVCQSLSVLIATLYTSHGVDMVICVSGCTSPRVQMGKYFRVKACSSICSIAFMNSCAVCIATYGIAIAQLSTRFTLRPTPRERPHRSWTRGGKLSR